MSPLEKSCYGVLLALAISFGGAIYHASLTRVSALEQQTRDLEKDAKDRIVSDQVALAEVKADLKYLRQALDRIEHKLEIIPLIPPPGSQFTPRQRSGAPPFSLQGP